VSRRSPHNERYQKHTEPKGQTRKSAAAAKPKRGGNAAAKAKASTKPKMPARGSYSEPDTPEYKKWRRVWWWSLGAGVLFVTASLVLQYVLHAEGALRSVSIALIIASYAALIVAFFVDFRKLRPLRLGLAPAVKPAKSAKPASSESAGDSDSVDDTSK
jgi:hypothetical protein